MTFSGRLFASGLPAAGVAVEAALDARQLSLMLPSGDRRRAIPLTQVRLRRAGFDAAQWELNWDDGSDTLALFISDPAVQARLTAQPPAALAAAIGGLRRSRRRSAGLRGLGISALVLWLALPLLAVLVLVAAARPLSAWMVGHVPVEHEQKLGDWWFQSQARELRFVRGTEANRVLEEIGERLTAGSAYRYRWHIVEDASLNAFAVPGGIVVVHSGLIRAADSAEELAGVLAHEVEHVELRHSLKALARQAGLRVALAAVIGDGGVAGQAAGQLASLRFSRAQEREADTAALALLERTGISAEGMLAMYKKLGAQTGGAAAPVWLSTHPATPERLQALRRRLQGRAAAPSLDYDWSRVGDSLNQSPEGLREGRGESGWRSESIPQ